MKYLILIFGIFFTSFSWADDNTNFICLAEAIYFESRNQPFIGQVAVAITILNRVKHDKFPSSICKVVRNCQFSYYCDGKPETIKEYLAWDTALLVTSLSLYNYEYFKHILGLDKVLYYHADYVSPEWSKQYKQVVLIGNHHFYKVN